MTERKMLGDFIYELRKEKGLSQQELGEMLGVSNKAVSKWETNESNPDISLIAPLSEILGVSADELLSQKRNETTENETEAEDGESRFDRSTFRPAWLKKVRPGEYVTDKKNKKGLPYVHINFAGGKAEGVVAIGISAHGIVAIGLKAKGIVSLGLLSMGILALGLLPIGIFAAGLLALGLAAAGSAAIGGVAAGGVAIGGLAVGGVAIGGMAVGGVAIGYYAVTSETGYAIGVIVKITENTARSMLLPALYAAPPLSLLPRW